MDEQGKMIVTAAMLLLLGLWGTAGGAPNTKVVSVLCNSQVYTMGDPFGTSLAYVLRDLQAVAPAREGHDYRNISPYPNAFAYGHAACAANLTSADCSSCLAAAAKQMLGTCAMRIGARCALYDCNIRYEQYPF
uniref:Antifungal protein ginkbilobin-2 n=1 Tax=Anthurium amnicola TaxID=1678845 RepID=A0A1D1YM58_9ARAE